jgi:asparagine synthase (glutamine-hydrolysing)
MSGLCGWLGYDATQEHALTRLSRMARHIGITSPAAHAVGTGAALITCGTTTLTHSCYENGLRVALFGHPHWRPETPASITAAASLATGVAAAYRQHGAQILAWLGGDFALAVLDEQRREALLAIDRTGTRSLTYRCDAQGLSFATHLGAVRASTTQTPSLDSQALYDYVYFHIIPTPATIYQGISRLLPGQYLHWRDGRPTLANYATTDYTEQHRGHAGENQARLFELLRNAVRDNLDSKAVGCFLSGGLDSSTVVGITSEITAAPVHCFSIGFAAEGYDEMEYARITARHFNAHHEAYYVTPDDVLAAIPLVAAHYDNPYGNASAVPSYYCAKLARDHGMDLLLGGDGGDELFGGNSRYATQWQLSLYHRIPVALRRMILEPLLQPEQLRAGPLRKLRSYIHQANLPPYERMERYNLLQRIGHTSVFTPGFLASVDITHPLRHLQNLYESVDSAQPITRMMAMDMKLTLADNDLPKVTGMCDLAGIDVAFPFLTDDLVEFAAHLPLAAKLKATQLRPFYRQAMRGYLPDAVLQKSKHGFGLPFGVWIQTHPGLRAITCDTLNALKKRDIIDARFIDTLIDHHIPQHPAYYGVMAWVLMMLELWFQTQHSVN